MRLILASASPRRRELLTKAGVSFEVVPSGADEDASKLLSPDKYAEYNAVKKAEWVAEREAGIVLGADTVVVLDGEILGKPKDKQDAILTLSRLSDREHTVITGFCLIKGSKRVVKSVSSQVFFNELSPELIEMYVATGKCMDKAGSYGVQDGFDIVKSVNGSLSNVIGLPIEEVLQTLSILTKEME